MEIEREIEELEMWLRNHDYIGTKIATGRATIEEYADVIAEMDEKARRLSELIDGHTEESNEESEEELTETVEEAEDVVESE